MVEEIDLGPYDFLDFGCSEGGSVEYARKIFGGERGLGFDSDAIKIEQARRRGYDAIEVDATRLPRIRGSVTFSIMSHFLEHLPGAKDAERCLAQAISVSSRFVYVQQPWFDSDPYLFRKGLKLYWSDWSGHPNRMTSLEFHTVLDRLRRRSVIARFWIGGRHRIDSSASTDVHTLASPVNSLVWADGTHAPKPEIVFEEPVYRELVVVVARHDGAVVDEVLRRVQRAERIFDSDEQESIAARSANPDRSEG